MTNRQKEGYQLFVYNCTDKKYVLKILDTLYSVVINRATPEVMVKTLAGEVVRRLMKTGSGP